MVRSRPRNPRLYGPALRVAQVCQGPHTLSTVSHPAEEKETTPKAPVLSPLSLLAGPLGLQLALPLNSCLSVFALLSASSWLSPCADILVPGSAAPFPAPRPEVTWHDTLLTVTVSLSPP